MHTTFLAAKHGIFTHGLESYTPTKTDTIYNWRSVRFVCYIWGSSVQLSCARLTQKLFDICYVIYLAIDFLLDGQIVIFILPDQHEAKLSTQILLHKLTQSL